MTEPEARHFHGRSSLGGARTGNPIHGRVHHDKYSNGIFMRFGRSCGVLTRHEATQLINHLADLVEEKP